MNSSSEEEDPNVCPECNDRNDPNPVDNKNRMIGCDGKCEKWFHWSCVGITQANKPGKTDDWFCKKCKKTESTEWKPDAADEDQLDVLPVRDQSSPGSTFKTLAQKKVYDSDDFPKKTRGRPVGSKGKNVRTSSNVKGRESWSTKKFSPSEGSTDAGVLKSQSQKAVENEQHQPAEEVGSKSSPRLPPGISISKSCETQGPPPAQPPNFSPTKSDSADSQLRRFPGISFSKEGQWEEGKFSGTSLLSDLLDGGEDSNGSPPNGAKSVLPSSGIKLIKTDQKERQLRERDEQVAQNKVTIDENNISDDQLLGEKRITYKRPALPSPRKEIEHTPIEELLKDSDENETERNDQKNSDHDGTFSNVSTKQTAPPSPRGIKDLIRNEITFEKIQVISNVSCCSGSRLHFLFSEREKT